MARSLQCNDYGSDVFSAAIHVEPARAGNNAGPRASETCNETYSMEADLVNTTGNSGNL